MGQTLSEPVTAKTSACCRDSNYRVGSSCMQGWRIKMEDCHVHILSLPDDPGSAFFAVYDGHGGAAMSQHAGKHLHEFITKTNEYKEGKIVEAMQQGFLEMDRAMQADATLMAEPAGTTVIAILVKDNILYCANAGDSRAVACVNREVVPLSRDHKPILDDERRRIEAAGGWVQFNRVNGHLALSRALGDFRFKRNKSKSLEEQIVTAFPEVQKFPITEDWEFVILACDGIWDVLSSDEVVRFVREHLANAIKRSPDNEVTYTDPEEICEELIDRCLAPDVLMGTGCDNMTVVLVCFLHGKPYTELITRCQIPMPPAEPFLTRDDEAKTPDIAENPYLDAQPFDDSENDEDENEGEENEEEENEDNEKW
ncbi:probable protein phosphatase 2C T23F11.1 [Venturia canescens]|uniref:probable protein phosphatase 2C T23F11.1 n=1 Tax=Venturia canescens TaxID=32260 RepID=UPI001C9CFE6D|nr:probable protein phosphatase 2C T23F11.1 [Venturia canescens]XP_043267408.1 probable protein phosphatase 2C T23F11.1 [Venturia canescens]XP_043267409.1 probable protein phosphatase 2C T23F11.1 [Venturia canescens]XP_043267410.1 probable protein phosphatase 2C T23F11.1 [Venturia canescens]XP_043267411.1 probable protein phosphatase 2C T23F11.1 [Venturia canescens]XP_043267412.1 probable protein phosphatase 2C T23F11.1 [Venturia canescens]